MVAWAWSKVINVVANTPKSVKITKQKFESCSDRVGSNGRKDGSGYTNGNKLPKTFTPWLNDGL